MTDTPLDITLEIIVKDLDDTVHTIPALAGWSVMEIIKDAKLPLKAECGGACACGTCHVYIDENWLQKLPPPNDEEIERLENDAFFVRNNSRLSCQIIMADNMNGLVVSLAKTDFA